MPGLVSIVITCFNYGQYLREAVASVDRCRPLPVELVIVNDGSTDPATIQVLNQLAGEGYLVIHQSNQGVGAGFNTGVSASRGEYFIPLGADDRIRPDFVRQGIDVLMHRPTISVVYGLPNYFGEPLPVPMPEVGEFSLERLQEQNYINATALIRRKDFDEIGGFDSNRSVHGLEDWELWLRMAERGKEFYFLAEVVFDYRIHMDSVSRGRSSASHRRARQYVESKHPMASFLRVVSNKLDRLEHAAGGCKDSDLGQLASELHAYVVDLTFAGNEQQAGVALDLLQRCETLGNTRFPTSLESFTYTVRDQFPWPRDDQVIDRMNSLVRQLRSLGLCAFSPKTAESFFWEVASFEAHRRGDRGRTWSSAMRAVLCNPTRIRNRGMLSIALRAIGRGLGSGIVPLLRGTGRRI